MAILIEKNIDLFGITIPSIYIRFGYKLDFDGNKIFVNTQKFISKNMYQIKNPHDGFEIDSFPSNFILPYNRENDGADILQYIHTKFKEDLSTDKTVQVPLMDPSTGDQLYDPSTGEVLTETIISQPKFAMDSSISIIDI